MLKSELERKYIISRTNVLLLIILSVVNIITILYNNSYFLFSLSFPRYLQGVIEYLIEEGEILREQVNYPLVAVFMALPIVLFLLCYIFTSNYRYKGFIWAIILFSIDSIIALYGRDVVDILFHVYIFVLLILGVKYGRKLHFKDYREEVKREPVYDVYGEKLESPDSTILRSDSPKGRKLLSATYQNLVIEVKRRYGLTELIINGNVYDEFRGMVETLYQLSATVKSVNVTFKLEGLKMRIFVNNTELIKKTRWI